MAGNPSQELIKFGQSIWYDNISKELLDKGDLKRLIDECGVRGVTSNPTIFDNAISKSSAYDSQVKALKSKNSNITADQVFEELAVEDIARAADLLLPVYNSSNGVDGFVSIEVSPVLAADTNGTLAEARKLYKRLNRPNIMIKVPGTKEGIPAVYALLEEGINVNITLLFSVENYEEVAKTYCDALRSRVKKGLPVDKIRSVASFFVSRVDSIVDAELKKIATPEAQSLLGKFGVANCKLAYKSFQKIFGDAFSDLKKAGALPQRPLWASTSTKDPSYPDLIYVDNLIGPDTVNTMPHVTLMAVVDHGKPASRLAENMAEAEEVKQRLEKIGVNLNKLLQDLQTDGVKKFIDSFKALNDSINKKIQQS